MFILNIYERILSAIILILIFIIYHIGDKKYACTYNGSSESNLDKFFKAALIYSNTVTSEWEEHYRKLFMQIYNTNSLPPCISIEDIAYELPYINNITLPKPTIHIGQRKLFLNELRFLAQYSYSGNLCYCVYAGAAPSNHTGYLAKLFPHVIFILVDPNPFNVYKINSTDPDPIILHKNDNGLFDINTTYINRLQSNQIYIINDLFTIDIAQVIYDFTERYDVPLLFISDIRTSIIANTPTDLDILWNLSQQYNWVKIMNPKMSMLKFRHPFRTDDSVSKHANDALFNIEFNRSKDFGIDFIKNYHNDTLTYFAGRIDLQAFGRVLSTETRLISDGKSISTFAFSKYESSLFYYNNIERGYGLHLNTNADKDLGFDYCGDCSLENYIWSEYIRLHNTQMKVLDGVRTLSYITKRDLIRGQHGRLFSQRTEHQLIKIAKVYHNTNLKI